MIKDTLSLVRMIQIHVEIILFHISFEASVAQTCVAVRVLCLFVF